MLPLGCRGPCTRIRSLGREPAASYYESTRNPRGSHVFAVRSEGSPVPHTSRESMARGADLAGSARYNRR